MYAESGIDVLVAEDNPVFQAMLGSMLGKWGYTVRTARDGCEAWNVLQKPGAPRMAILDWMMPRLDGVEVCRRVRGAGAEPYIYLILLTARTESEDLVQGMEAGADDYLTKPFNAHELRVRLRAGRRILELQEQLMLAREELREQATHDGLTGVWNRATVLELLGNAVERGSRERSPVAVLMLDLDRFKQVNDTYGHLAGDSVLREAARRMKASVRAYDAIGRYGGEEFVVVLSGCDFEDAFSQAERLRCAIAAQPFSRSGESIPVTCSIGMAWSREPDRQSAKRLLSDADAALYAAKNGGRNRIETADVVSVATAAV